MSVFEQETVVRLGGKPFDMLSHGIRLINNILNIFYLFYILTSFPSLISYCSLSAPLIYSLIYFSSIQKGAGITWETKKHVVSHCGRTSSSPASRLSKAFCIKIGSKKPAHGPTLCSHPTAMYPTNRPRYTMSSTSQSMPVSCRHPSCLSEVYELPLV